MGKQCVYGRGIFYQYSRIGTGYIPLLIEGGFSNGEEWDRRKQVARRY